MDGAPCDGLLHGTILREPLDRLVSNTCYARDHGWKASSAEVASLPRAGNKGCKQAAGGSSWGACFDVGKSEFFGGCGALERSAAAYDNFYVRTLAGAEAMWLPAGELDRSHLAVAKARLSKFDVVIVLDQYEQQRRQLQSAFGWQHTELGRSVVTVSGNQNGSCTPFSAPQLEQLRQANQLDYELYCYGAELARIRTARADAELEAAGRGDE